MAKPIRLRGSLLSLDAREGVERPEPGQAPTKFRIWRAGPNVCKWTGGPPESFFFTARSAELLAKAQADRGLLYMFDLDHRSLSPRSNQDGEAAGWHRLDFPLDADGNPECWAVACEWVPEVKAGLESKPPKWRYFSPVWEVDPETNEIISYTNCAVTNNPATLEIPSLAAALVKRRKAKTTNKGSKAMDKQTALDALADIATEPLTDAQKAAVDLVSQFLDSVGDSKEESENQGSDEDSEENQAKKADGSNEDESDKKDSEEEQGKKANTGKEPTIASVQAELDEERKERILDKAGITGPKRSALMAEPLDVVRKVVDLAAGMAPRGTRPVQVARNESQAETNPAMAMLDAIGDRALAQIKNNSNAGKAGE